MNHFLMVFFLPDGLQKLEHGALPVSLALPCDELDPLDAVNLSVAIAVDLIEE